MTAPSSAFRAVRLCAPMALLCITSIGCQLDSKAGGKDATKDGAGGAANDSVFAPGKHHSKPSTLADSGVDMLSDGGSSDAAAGGRGGAPQSDVDGASGSDPIE